MKTTIIVQNLKCGGCASTITSKLSEIENISDLNVNVEDSRVSFVAQNEAAAFLVMDKLKTLGYPSIEDNNSLVSKAKSFVSCATGKLSK
ncbi:heavy-metal-associated domain-containing protein [Olleya sp. R77988]|uniref:heavy-metal-associated domain-containing protein n=1 Tax=Olleya sp. R77988 TaxID=3093875 RepID=UPI0037CA0939